MAKTKNSEDVTLIRFDASKNTPDTHKIPHHDIFTKSDLLLLETKKGLTPGYLMKHNMDWPGGNPPRKKGELMYTDELDNILTDVKYYYPLDQKPTAAKKEKPVVVSGKAEPANGPGENE